MIHISQPFYKNTKFLIGMVFIAGFLIGIMPGVAIGGATLANPQPDMNMILSILYSFEKLKASSIGISGIPDYVTAAYPVTWYINVTQYIYSPLVPISNLILSTNWTGPLNVTVFNHNKTVKIDLTNEITFHLRICITYFGVTASDIILVEVND